MAASAITCPFLRMAGPRVVDALSSPALSVLAKSCPHLSASGVSPEAVLSKMGFGEPASSQPKTSAPFRAANSQLASPFSGADLWGTWCCEVSCSPRAFLRAAPACNLPSKPPRSPSPMHVENAGSFGTVGPLNSHEMRDAAPALRTHPLRPSTATRTVQSGTRRASLVLSIASRPRGATASLPTSSARCVRVKSF